MDRLEQRIVNGEDAKQLLSNQMLQRAFSDTRKGILEAWASLPETQTGRMVAWFQGKNSADDLHRMVKALDRVQRCIEAHIESGKLAQHEINTKRTNLRRA